MEDLLNSIGNTLQEIEKTTRLFYQQNQQDGFQLLNNTLNELIKTVNLIFVYKAEDKSLTIDEQTINTVLGNAMKAIEEGDTILLSDIFVFDLKPIFENCLENTRLNNRSI